ncbi:hypothetical protein H6G06_03950 [Anabaena sphaerica FACHB-251]|uniref:Uncharacterized protein n=1 Tax=Anabaena sphaerica FACHB-251 TaxID=2692883 RepID=A0A926ZZP9_9NOST|nr:hypothetical protein [Anabaena sphaerica]MBD2292658.1 hypothetical protein [Anabaena sphaerica FACHB-251]
MISRKDAKEQRKESKDSEFSLISLKNAIALFPSSPLPSRSSLLRGSIITHIQHQPQIEQDPTVH